MPNKDLLLENMRALAASIHEAVCGIDENGIVTIWNPGAEKIYNVLGGDIIGKPLKKFFPNALLDKVRATREARENVSHMPRDKADTHILISAMPLYLDGEFKGVISTDRDYNEVMRLYADLEKAQARLSYLENEMKKSSGILSGIIGKDAGFRKKINAAAQIAPTHTNVMITGESGTGKEVFARGIHELSGREGLFIPINCSAIPSELFESEFFGYAPGAFTGASRKGKAGFFELANGGTVFLDEIGEMPFSAQAKLLRVLQEHEIVRVGGESPLRVDVRVISATNRNLKQMMAQGRFREDLYYRLNVVEITLPSLRDRRQDVPLLIDHFMRAFAQRNGRPAAPIDPDAVRLLCAYNWPGNVRELMNVVENLVVTSNGKSIERDNLPEYITSAHSEAGHGADLSGLDLAAATRQLETERIKKALETCKGNKSKTAAMLNIPRATLYNKMAEYGIPK
ncbi:MAG: sigma 54-interacting transcriptional regulator [Deltaproteobacteria bacterium]|jgi:transcriptional regulator with PAS, ATPase and Fis domain|nr:sigma 54-interacting transcriptional regulator [Deltaproteobacteria bacterium]